MASQGRRSLGSLQQSVFLWIGGLLLSVATLLGYVLIQSHQHYTRSASEISQSLALSIETFLTAHFQAMDLALRSASDEFAARHRAGNFQPEAFNQYLRSLRLRVPNATAIRGTDVDGTVLYGDDVDRGSLHNLADREHFRRALSERGLIISLPIVSRLTGDLILPATRALLTPDGRFAGTVSIHTAVPRLEAYFSSVRVGTQGVVTLIDLQRRVLVRYPRPPDANPDKVVVLNAPFTVRAVEARLRQANYESHSPVDGVSRTLTLRRIGDYDAYVICGIGTGDYLHPWYRELAAGIATFGLLCILSIAFGLNLKRRWRSELRVQSLEASAQAHRELEAVITAIPDALLELSADGRCLRVMSTWDTGWLPHSPSPLGRSLEELFPPETAASLRQALEQALAHDISRGTEIALTRDATQHWYELSIACARNGAPERTRLIMLARDITARKLAQAQVEQLAYSDLLTRLPNRRMFMERLRQSLAASQRSGKYGALLFLDLDHFKTVNDTLGHQYGDLLLQQVAQRLRSIVREEDVVARLGGDEFVLILEQLDPQHDEAAAQAMLVARKIVEALDASYDLDGRRAQTTASVGVSLFLGQAFSVEELLKRADTSMYQAKGAGRNAVRFFDPATQAAASARSTLEAALRQAVVNEEFLLCYQPQVDHAGRCIGAEALIRWNSPSLGMVSPAQFIPLAEESGLISPIGHWVMAEACRCLADWQTAAHTRALTLAVNVSARQFAHPTFASEVCELVEYYGIAPSRLKLELTESLLINNIDTVIERMQQLARFGIHLSLDDFGTGFSSMAYLKRLPLSQIKIDRSFTNDILHDHHDTAICEAVIALCRTMELEVIAEGIETQAQWDFLLNLGCRLGQGYLFGRPMPAAQFALWLAEHSTA